MKDRFGDGFHHFSIGSHGTDPAVVSAVVRAGIARALPVLRGAAAREDKVFHQRRKQMVDAQGNRVTSEQVGADIAAVRARILASGAIPQGVWRDIEEFVVLAMDCRAVAIEECETANPITEEDIAKAMLE